MKIQEQVVNLGYEPFAKAMVQLPKKVEVGDFIFNLGDQGYEGDIDDKYFYTTIVGGKEIKIEIEDKERLFVKDGDIFLKMKDSYVPLKTALDGMALAHQDEM